MRTREEEEKENYKLLLKAAGGDPKVLAQVVKDLLLADKATKVPTRPRSKDEQAMFEAVADILKRSRRT